MEHDRHLLAFINGQENATLHKSVESHGSVDLRHPHPQNTDFRRHRRLSHQEEGKAMSVNTASCSSRHLTMHPCFFTEMIDLMDILILEHRYLAIVIENIMLNCILFSAFNAGVLVANWINGGCTTPVGLLEEKALQNLSAGPVAPHLQFFRAFSVTPF